MDENHKATNTLMKRALGALDEGYFSEALRLFEQLAALGSKPALLALGDIHERGGKGVARDFDRAKHFYERALTEGRAIEAALALGRIYSFGIGGQADYSKAAIFYRMLEPDEHPVALYRLGEMFEHGHGCDLNKALAADYYARAAMQGHIHAKKRLAKMQYGNKNMLGALWTSLSAMAQEKILILKSPRDIRLRIY